MNTNGSKAFSWMNNSTGWFVAGMPVRARVNTDVSTDVKNISTGARTGVSARLM